MATAIQLEHYRLRRDALKALGIPQTNFYHRQNEGTLTPVVGFTQNVDYSEPNPRTQDNPMNTAVPLWVSWKDMPMRGTSNIAGDTKAMKAWNFRLHGECPAIDDNLNAVVMQDEDFMVDQQNHRWRIENPLLDHSGAYWSFEGVRHR